MNRTQTRKGNREESRGEESKIKETSFFTFDVCLCVCVCVCVVQLKGSCKGMPEKQKCNL